MVTCTLDRKDNTISFAINGVDKGVAFRNVLSTPMHALLELYNNGGSVMLL